MRPKVHTFAAEALARALTGLAELKDAGFAWSGDDYPHRKRGLKPALGPLARHGPALTIMLDYAPSGFPAHSCLRMSLDILHRRHGVFPSAPDYKLLSEVCAA